MRIDNLTGRGVLTIVIAVILIAFLTSGIIEMVL